MNAQETIARLENDGYYLPDEAEKAYGYAKTQFPGVHTGAVMWHQPYRVVALFVTGPENHPSYAFERDSVLRQCLQHFRVETLATYQNGKDGFASLVTGIAADTADDLMWLAHLIGCGDYQRGHLKSFLKVPYLDVQCGPIVEGRAMMARQYKRLGFIDPCEFGVVPEFAEI